MTIIDFKVERKTIARAWKPHFQPIQCLKKNNNPRLETALPARAGMETGVNIQCLEKNNSPCSETAFPACAGMETGMNILKSLP